jgi:hypothetical protein
MNDDGSRAVIDRLGEQPGKTLTPERLEKHYDLVDDGCW